MSSRRGRNGGRFRGAVTSLLVDAQIGIVALAGQALTAEQQNCQALKNVGKEVRRWGGNFRGSTAQNCTYGDQGQPAAEPVDRSFKMCV